MKHRILAALLSAALFLSLAGCAAAPDIPQPTLEELLDQVNAEHQSIQREELDPTPYLRTSLSDESWMKISAYITNTRSDYDPDLELTHSQAVEDINYLFDAFYYAYGFYDYFGGHAAFDAAQEKMLEALETKDTLTCQELEQIIVSQLGFIKDGHFRINETSPSPTQVPFFFRQTAFLKTEDGYQTVNGKTVESVENHTDLDDLFKRSISKEGQIVYYPVLLKEAVFDGQSEFKNHICDEKLTVHYTDGTTETLTAEPWKLYYENLPKDQNTDLRETDGIPVFQFNNFDKDYQRATINGAQELKAKPVSMLDLRSNTGGAESVLHSWINRYAYGQNVPGNGLRFSSYDGSSENALEDGWIDHDNLLILLTGKITASSGEIILDTACNLENSLIIGENTYGAMLGNSGHVVLPNSKTAVQMSMYNFYLTPEGYDYFEELRGFEPDLWVPAGEAETLAAKLIQRLSGAGE